MNAKQKKYNTKKAILVSQKREFNPITKKVNLLQFELNKNLIINKKEIDNTSKNDFLTKLGQTSITAKIYNIYSNKAIIKELNKDNKKSTDDIKSQFTEMMVLNEINLEIMELKQKDTKLTKKVALNEVRNILSNKYDLMDISKFNLKKPVTYMTYFEPIIYLLEQNINLNFDNISYSNINKIVSYFKKSVDTELNYAPSITTLFNKYFHKVALNNINKDIESYKTYLSTFETSLNALIKLETKNKYITNLISKQIN